MLVARQPALSASGAAYQHPHIARRRNAPRFGTRDGANAAVHFEYTFGGASVLVEHQIGAPVYKFDSPQRDQRAFIECPAGAAVASMKSNDHSLETAALELFACILLPTL